MLLDHYEPYFFNANFREAASGEGWEAYRGELVLVEGEVADDQGRRKPPHALFKQAIVLTKGEELKLISGSLEELQHWPAFMEKFGADLNPASVAVMFTVNIPKPFISVINGATVAFVPLTEGLCWNELIDLAALEKGDFKGQGAGDKVVTVFNAFQGFKYKYPSLSVDEAMKTTNNAKREVHGAV
ncbi:MAG: hypothetical protein KA603_10545 [Azonexus sp.]|jgi:hypothetical protein|nr:hypothetical protein [Betaproteobacteria bacterium]MBK8919118.1 hypothetical protein [Betaproteobacteria bacterium]MBP6036560.1 hypothetical protein [Azonexus sp.]MBP6907168.1 hypothetical protein [Azonexus sp.]